MRNAILGAASALALASPAMAADLPVPRYSEVPSYEYRTAPTVVVEEPAPVIVAPPPVVVDEYPICSTPSVCGSSVVCIRRSGLAWRMGPSRSLPRPLVKSSTGLERSINRPSSS